MIICALLDELKELLVGYYCLSLYGSVFNHVVYLRICSFLRGDFTEIFTRTKWVISSSNYFNDIVSIASIFPFYDEGGDKYDMLLDKTFLLKFFKLAIYLGEHIINFG